MRRPATDTAIKFFFSVDFPIFGQSHFAGFAVMVAVVAVDGGINLGEDVSINLIDGI